MECLGEEHDMCQVYSSIFFKAALERVADEGVVTELGDSGHSVGAMLGLVSDGY